MEVKINLIINKLEHKQILNRIMAALCALFIHKAIITVIVVLSKGYAVHTNLFTMKNIQDVLFSNFSKWDSNWYINIAKNGYYSAKSSAFFPLYPLLLRLFRKITSLNYIVCGIAISSICFLIALYYLQKLVEIDFNSLAAKKTVYILALNPVAFYFTSVYTESLFFMLSVLCLYYIRSKKWINAGIFGALCSATRNTGIILALPFVVEYIFTILPKQAYKKKCSLKQRFKIIKLEFNISNIKKYKSGLWVCIIPVGLIIYMIYLYNKFGNACTFISSQSDYGRGTLNPIISIAVGMWATLKMTVYKYGFRIQFYYFFEFVSVLCFVVLSILCVRKMRFSYWVLMVISLLIPLTKPALTGTVTDYFVSFPRYMMVSYPFMLSWYLIISRNNTIYILLITISIIILEFNVYFWSLKYWVA